jgi:hypothetical protein
MSFNMNQQIFIATTLHHCRDTGTHRYAPVNESWVKPPLVPTDDAVEVVAALKATNGDGINGDTMGHVPQVAVVAATAVLAVLAVVK